MDFPIILNAATAGVAKLPSISAETADGLATKLQAALLGLPAPPPGLTWAVMGAHPAGAGAGGRWFCELSIDLVDLLAPPCGAVFVPIVGDQFLFFAVEGAADFDAQAPQVAGGVPAFLSSLGAKLQAKIQAAIGPLDNVQIRTWSAGSSAGHRFLLLALANLGEQPGPCPGGGGAFSAALALDLSVNSAGADGFDAGYAELRTGSRVNLTGSFNGGGLGNKAIMGFQGFSGMLLSALTDISFIWENQLGPGGRAPYAPPGPVSVTVPYVNLIVDFGTPPIGTGGIRLLALLDNQESLPISAALGVHTNLGGNVIQASWTSAMHVIVLGSPGPGPGGNPAPGGVADPPAAGGVTSTGIPMPIPPNTTQDNAYLFSALVAACPGAKLIDAFPANPIVTPPGPTGDGGMACGAIIPAIVICSSDSTTAVKSGKRINTFIVNGTPLFP